MKSKSSKPIERSTVNLKFLTRLSEYDIRIFAEAYVESGQFKTIREAIDHMLKVSLETHNKGD